MGGHLNESRLNKRLLGPVQKMPCSVPASVRALLRKKIVPQVPHTALLQGVKNRKEGNEGVVGEGVRGRDGLRKWREVESERGKWR